MALNLYIFVFMHACTLAYWDCAYPHTSVRYTRKSKIFGELGNSFGISGFPETLFPRILEIFDFHDFVPHVPRLQNFEPSRATEDSPIHCCTGTYNYNSTLCPFFTKNTLSPTLYPISTASSASDSFISLVP